MKARLITIVLVCLSVCCLVIGEGGDGGEGGEDVVHNASDEDVVHSVSKRTVKAGPLFGPGRGSSCTVKGSYCSCHYCKCEHGNIHCQKHGATSLMHGHGKIGDLSCDCLLVKHHGLF